MRDLCPDIADKAAALMHSLALKHPFVDGNKRVAAFAAIVFVESNGHECLATPDELVQTTLAVVREIHRVHDGLGPLPTADDILDSAL